MKEKTSPLSRPMQTLLRRLKTAGKTLSAAESCTGGWFAKTAVDVPHASEVFYGGVVSYTNAVKKKLLSVSPSSLARYTAVSAPVVQEMAEGVRALLSTDYAVAVSGLAGPGGGSEEIPVGRVFIAVASEKKTEVRQYDFAGGRQSVRRQAVSAMIDFLMDCLSKQEERI